MPIRPDLRHHYGREWREQTRPRILARAGDKCEQCRVPNRAIVLRIDRFPGWWATGDRQIYDERGRPLGLWLGRGLDDEIRPVRIVLTIAHLNQTPGDDRDENLAALCQWCHLRHDLQMHLRSARETRCDRKDAGRPILQKFAEVREKAEEQKHENETVGSS